MSGEGTVISTDLVELAEAIADRVREHPGVVRLDAGRYGDVVSTGSRSRVVGVRVTGVDEPVEVGVVLRLDEPIPVLVRSVRCLVRDVVGEVRVDVVVSDVD